MLVNGGTVSDMRSKRNHGLRHASGLILFGVSIVACTTMPTDIGTVDIERAYQRSPLVMASAARLNAEFAATRGNIMNRGRQLAELRQQLDLGSDDIDADVRSALEARYAADTAELMELQNRYRANLDAAQKREGDWLTEIVTRVAREVAEQEGLTLLLNQDAVLYQQVDAPAPRDITDLVALALLDYTDPAQRPAN